MVWLRLLMAIGRVPGSGRLHYRYVRNAAQNAGGPDSRKAPGLEGVEWVCLRARIDRRVKR
jgi:hypothetical protein